MLTSRDRSYFSRLRESAWVGVLLWTVPPALMLVAIAKVYMAIQLAGGAGHSAFDLLSLWTKDRGVLDSYLGAEVRALRRLYEAILYSVVSSYMWSFLSGLRRDARVAHTLKQTQEIASPHGPGL